MNSEFIKNVLTLMTGSALGQGVALLLSPIITRLYTPSDFSAFEQYAFLITVLTVVVTGKYEYAIMHPDNREDARHIAGLAMRIAIISCSILLVILLFTSGYISTYSHNEDLRYWLWTLPFALVAIALFNIVNFWFSREKDYKVAAISKLIYSGAGEPIKVAAGLINTGAAGLIAGTFAGHIAAAWYSWKKFFQNEPKTFFGLSKQRMKTLAKEHGDYPKYAIWGGTLNSLAQWAHVAVFTFFYGEKALIPIGLIALSRRIFLNPLNILSNSYAQVFYQRISEIKSPTELKDFYQKNLLRFLAFGALLVLIVQLLPANTLGYIFGNSWKEALNYLKILSYWYALNFVTGSLSSIFYRLQLQLLTLIVDIFHFVIVVAAFWWASSNGLDEIGAVEAMVWAKVIYLVISGTAVIYFLHRNCRYEKMNDA